MRPSAGLLLFIGLLPIATAADITLRRGGGLEPETLDPQLVQSREAGNIVRDLYEGLIREGPAGETLPGVAKSWSVSEDGLVYDFQLRDNARWCDGLPVTAAEVAAGLRRNFDPSAGTVNPQRWSLLAGAEARLQDHADVPPLGIEVLSPRALRIRLAYPAPYLLHLLHHPSAYPVPLDHPPPPETCPAGRISNGAYALESHQVHDALSMVKNQWYWDRGEVEINRVIYYPISDPDAELARFRAGQLHITAGLPPGRVAWAKEHLPAALRVAPFAATYFYGINLGKAPLGGHPRLRRALSLAIDRELLVNLVTAGGELPAFTLVPPGLPGGYEPPVPAVYALPDAAREKQARELLAGSGVDPNAFHPTVLYNEGAVHSRVVQAIQSMWLEVLGIQARIEKVEWKVLLVRRDLGVPAIFRDGWSADYPDPLSFLQIASPDSPNNNFRYDSPAFSAALEAAETADSSAARTRYLQAAEAILLDDLPLIPIYHYSSKHLVDPRVGGWRDNTSDHHLSRYLTLDVPNEG